MNKGVASLIIHSWAGHFWGRRAGHGIPDLKTRPKNYFDLPLRCLARRQQTGSLLHETMKQTNLEESTTDQRLYLDTSSTSWDIEK